MIPDAECQPKGSPRSLTWATASPDEALLLQNCLTRPSTNSGFAGVQRKKGRTRTEEEEGRDPQGAGFGRNSQGPESRTTSPACRRSLPQRRYLFSHVIHDAHEACQQFSFLSSGKFLLGLLLAAFLHPGGCHPPSARFTPGAHRVGQEVARSWHAGACLPHTEVGTWLPRHGPGQAGGSSVASAVGHGPAAPSEARRDSMSQARLCLQQKQSLEEEPVFKSYKYYVKWKKPDAKCHILYDIILYDYIYVKCIT